MTTMLRYAFLTVPALVLAGVLLIHPNDEADTVYESVRPSWTRRRSVRSRLPKTGSRPSSPRPPRLGAEWGDNGCQGDLLTEAIGAPLLSAIERSMVATHGIQLLVAPAGEDGTGR